MAARQLPRHGAPGQRLLDDDFDATTGGSLGQQRLDDNLDGEASGMEWLTTTSASAWRGLESVWASWAAAVEEMH
jgi:hypothetical protein